MTTVKDRILKARLPTLTARGRALRDRVYAAQVELAQRKGLPRPPPFAAPDPQARRLKSRDIDPSIAPIMTEAIERSIAKFEAALADVRDELTKLDGPAVHNIIWNRSHGATEIVALPPPPPRRSRSA